MRTAGLRKLFDRRAGELLDVSFIPNSIHSDNSDPLQLLAHESLTRSRRTTGFSRVPRPAMEGEVFEVEDLLDYRREKKWPVDHVD